MDVYEKLTENREVYLSAKERILSILDESSFIEVGALAKETAVVTGYGTIGGKLVYIYGQEFNINGGMLTVNGSEKILRIMEMALKIGAPLIQIMDSIGGSANEGIKLLSAYGKIINMSSKLSGVIPQISVIMGPCVGISALIASISDITLMVKNSGEFYVNSSEAIERSCGKYTASHMYANAESSSKNGSVEVVVEDDKEAFDYVRRILQYIPSNNYDIPSFNDKSSIRISNDELDKAYSEGILTTRSFLETIVDDDSILEMDNGFGNSILTAFVKIKGMTTGVIATDAAISPYMDIRSCEKAVRFIKICNAFNISLLSIVDNNGFERSLEEELNGLAASAAKLVYVLAEANVPKVSIIIGNAIGAGYITFASKEAAFDVVMALPNAMISAADPEILVREIYSSEIADSLNPSEFEGDLLKNYIDNEVNAFKAAEGGYIDDIIKPSEVEYRILSAFDMLQSKREIRYPKKHGSILI